MWYESGAEKFIRNIKSNYFIPHIILFVYNDKTYILDGQQRLTSLYLYKKGKFKREINWDEIIKLERENETNLPERLFAVNDADKEWLKERELSYVLLQQVVPDQQSAKKFFAKVFRDINAQGVILEAKELRQSIFWIVDKNNAKDLFNLGDFHNIDWIKYIAFASLYISIDCAESTLYNTYMSKFTNRKLASGDKNYSSQEYESMYQYFLYEYFELGNDTDVTIPADIQNLLQEVFNNIKRKINLESAKPIVSEELLNISRHKPYFTNVVEFDIYLFGLTYYALKGHQLSQEHDSIYENLDNKVLEYRDTRGDSENTALHIKERMFISIDDAMGKKWGKWIQSLSEMFPTHQRNPNPLSPPLHWLIVSFFFFFFLSKHCINFGTSCCWLCLTSSFISNTVKMETKCECVSLHVN